MRQALTPPNRLNEAFPLASPLDILAKHIIQETFILAQLGLWPQVEL